MRKRKLAKRVVCVSAAICLAAAMMTSCGNEETSNVSSGAGETDTTAENQAMDQSITTPGVNVDLVGEYSQEEIDADWDEATATKIALNGGTATVTGDGASAASGKVTITEAGTYVLTGNGSDVQVAVEASEDAAVQLVLDGVTLTHSKTAPINVVEGDKVTITLADGTENQIKDTRAAYVEDETEASAASEDELIEGAIFSEIDMVINGSGTLVVEAGFDDAIRTKDDLKLISGTYQVTAQDDAFVGKDSISIRDGEFTVNALGTAFKSNNAEDLEKGFVVVDGGKFDLTATEGDGFHGEFVLVINDCDALIRECEEGLEAMNIIINGGNIDLTSTDDGVNISEAENYTETFGAELEASQDAAQGQMQMPEGDKQGQMPSGEAPAGQDGEVPELPEGVEEGQMPEMPEGMELPEGAEEGQMPEMPEGMELPEGMEEGQMPEGMQPGQMPDGMQSGQMPSEGDSSQTDQPVDHIPGALIINGGTLKVTAEGDGLDSNGDILITGGTTIVCGPTSADNGSLDYADTFDMTGGVLVVAGNQGMEQSITSSTIATVTMNFNSQQAAGTEVSILDESGSEVFNFMANHDFSYVAFASPEVKADSVYKIIIGSETAEGTAAINQAMNMGFGGMGGGRGQMPEGEAPAGQGGDSSQMPEQTGSGQTPPEKPAGNAQPGAGNAAEADNSL